jgi:small GTP-binding protein
MTKEELPIVKIMVLGDFNVGKTNLISQFVTSEFHHAHKSTVGVDVHSKVIGVDGQRVNVQIWDPSGQERYRSIVWTYARSAHGALLVYDISLTGTFESLPMCVNELRGHAPPGIPVMLVGNKSDLEEERVILTDKGEEFARSNNLMFLETSALTASNVVTAFDLLVTKIVRDMGLSKFSNETPDIQPPPAIGIDVTAESSVESSCC